uniref:Presenilin n=1 Tax=Caenorhabditis japonica TaxID=281687 RepID=A0A8R1DNC0_CAEJA
MEVLRKMISELNRSSQLKWTLFSVIVNMLLTLSVWIGVYGMEVNSELSRLYFLDTASNSTTGNPVLDGAINGMFTIVVLGIVSFVMLGFVLYDFQNLVKTWLIFSCLLILFGVSGQTFYDLFSQLVDQETENGRNLTLVLTILPTLVYGLAGIVAFLANGSLLLHQCFVVSNCSLIAVFYLRAFPRHTTWFVLFIVLFWDLFAVLTPMGPLKRVQEKASDYSNNILKFLMFAADDNRQSAGADRAEEVNEGDGTIRRGVKQLIAMYSKQEAQDEEFAQKIRQRRSAWNPDSGLTEQSPLVETEPSPSVPTEHQQEEKEDKQMDSESSSESCSESASIASGDSNADDKEKEEEDDEYQSSNIETAEECDMETWQQLVNEANAKQGDNKSNLTAADALNDGETVRLGFGDFVFYSLLIGQAAASGCPIAVVFAAAGILFGLLVTLTVLSTEESTTPALPVPVLCGTFCYFTSKFVWENLIMRTG